jgi:gliding motility-associated-like protein
LIVSNQTITPSNAWSILDCDNDGLTNGDEINFGADVLNPDTDGDGVLDGTEVNDSTDATNPCDLILSSQTVSPSATWNDSDCDGDGVTNGEEVNNGSNPFDSCSPVPCDVIIPEAMTPDGDGINDTFVIKGIEKYPTNSISIFNRWGDLVYQKENYQNDWDGTSMNSLTIGEDALPTGTYYYLFDTKTSPVNVIKGYVFIQR